MTTKAQAPSIGLSKEIKDLMTFLKLKSGAFNLPASKYFEFCSDERLRSCTSNKLKINSVTTELFKGTYFNRIHYLWNNLPEEMRKCDCSLPTLKKKLYNDYYIHKTFNPDNPNALWV